MQPWPNSDQPGSDGHTSWQQGYGYADEQNGQFDPNQTWPQPMSGQTPDYSHMTAQDGSTSNYFESAHPGGGDAFLAGHVRGDATGQHAFHGGHDPLAINQQFAQPGQDVIDPAFSDLHQDIYGQSGGKINLGRDEGIQSLSQSPGHHHAPSQPFTHHEFSYAPQNERSFEPAVAPQYTQAQLIPQQSRQQNHTPVQQPYDSLQGRYPQSQAFSRPQQSPVQHQPPYSQNQPFSSTVNNQPNQYQPNPQIEYQSGQQPQQQAYRQPSFSPKPLIPYPQSSQTPPAHQALQPVPSQTNAAVIQPAHQVHQHGAMPQHQAPPQQQNMSEDDLTISQAKTAESPPKKRKRATKSTTENVVIFEPADSPMPGDSSIDAPGKRLDEVDGLTAPEPSAEEAQSLAQAKEPSIKGLPHILYDGVVKLPGELYSPAQYCGKVVTKCLSQRRRVMTNCLLLSRYHRGAADASFLSWAYTCRVRFKGDLRASIGQPRTGVGLMKGEPRQRRCSTPMTMRCSHWAREDQNTRSIPVSTRCDVQKIRMLTGCRCLQRTAQVRRGF